MLVELFAALMICNKVYYIHKTQSEVAQMSTIKAIKGLSERVGNSNPQCKTLKILGSENKFTFNFYEAHIQIMAYDFIFYETLEYWYVLLLLLLNKRKTDEVSKNQTFYHKILDFFPCVHHYLKNLVAKLLQRQYGVILAPYIPRIKIYSLFYKLPSTLNSSQK